MKVLNGKTKFIERRVVAPFPVPVDYRILAIFDIHLDASMELTPSYKIAKRFCRDIKPEYVVNGGDMLDLIYLSKFTKDTPLLTENKRFYKDCELAKRELEFWRENSTKEMHFIPGNHEDRITRYIERFPMFEGFISIRKSLGIDELDISYTEFNAVLSIGKPNFTHGWYWNKYHAMKHLNDMGDHLFYGHTHDHQVVVKPVRAKRWPFMAMSMGCLCDCNPHWKRNKPNEWISGVGLFEVSSSGCFTPLFIPIIDGELSYGGYTWR